MALGSNKLRRDGRVPNSNLSTTNIPKRRPDRHSRHRRGQSVWLRAVGIHTVEERNNVRQATHDHT